MEKFSKKFIVSSDVLKEFFNVDKILSVEKFGNGHINWTYLVKFPKCSYIIQRINDTVFENPISVMYNIELVTNYIRKQAIIDGKDPSIVALTTIFTRYGQNMAIVNDEYWRCMRFIEEGRTYEKAPTPEIFAQAGNAIGSFHLQLAGFSPKLLVDPIKNFHNTKLRYNNFLTSVHLNKFGRKTVCSEEINYIKSHENDCGIIVDLLENNEIPLRVTHNDTKFNNIMISKKTGKALCLIDFDTIMKGSIIYDYGDALRIGASTAPEDEVDLFKVKVDYEMFESFSRAYLETMKGYITETEIRHLYDGFFIMTFEVGMRFLTDFLEGDVYFHLSPIMKKKRPYINLERARCQLALAREIENDRNQLINILNNILKELEYDIVLD